MNDAWNLTFASTSPQRVAADYADARGIAFGDLPDFLSERPGLPNPLTGMPQWQRAIERVGRAVSSRERITVFGDYDVDGVTSSFIILDLLRSLGAAGKAYLPDRLSEGYGLREAAVTNCLEAQSPQLMIVVDCGSNAHSVLQRLRQVGVDTIVLDHHQVTPPPDGGHPAFAHLNPKAHPEVTSVHARELSAAGLAFFFAMSVAELCGADRWRREQATVVAGLGTLCDVMPVSGLNRALIKNSLACIVERRVLRELPGLQALMAVCGVTRCDEGDYGFKIGPRLNAAGRLAHARDALRLLYTRDVNLAFELATALEDTNRARRAVQEEVQSEADTIARNLLTIAPTTKVLCLYRSSWHPGVIGIVAGRVREKYQQPVIVCGCNEEGYVKGSGRSVPGVDLGQIVSAAVRAGVLLDGGGHAPAAGVTMTPDMVPRFSAWLEEYSRNLRFSTTPSYEIYGRLDEARTPSDLTRLHGQLAPFGAGNPRPLFFCAAAHLEKYEERRAGSSNAIHAHVRLRSDSNRVVFAAWPDCGRARALFVAGSRYDIVCEFENATDGRSQWRIVDARPAQAA